MTSPPALLTTTAPADARGRRLDRVLADAFPEISRSRFTALIAEGLAAVEGRTADDPALKLKGGERLEVRVPPPTPAIPEGEAIALDVVFEDAALIVIDKPAGLVVHPAAGHAAGTLVNALIAHCGLSLSGINGERRPGIVHRLDKETSGLMVAAKTDAAHRGLSEQFAAHGRDGRLERGYLALVWGHPRRRSGTIDAALARSSGNRTKIAVSKSASARAAVTHYELVETFVDCALMRCRLETGRTHQIRVHMAHLGHPLLGDKQYGSGFAASAGKLAPEARAALSALGRQALHAAVLGFEHPVTGQRFRFESEVPEEMEALLKALRSGA